MSKITTFTLTDEKKKMVRDKMGDIVEFCKNNSASMYAIVAIENTENGTLYEMFTYNALKSDTPIPDSEAKALLDELSEICIIERIPMYAVIAVNEVSDGTQTRDEKRKHYEPVVYNADSHDIVLTDNQIRKHMLISGGFDAVAPRETISFMPSENFIKYVERDNHEED